MHFTGCASAPPTVTTAEGKAAFSADQVITRLGEAADVVIHANQATPPKVPDRVAIPLVKVIRATVKIVEVSPSGWLAAANTAYNEFKKTVSPADQQEYAVYFKLVETLLAAGATPTSTKLLAG